ncbi:unnamed protein product [Cladocopium goreaui]|uniref:Na(+)/H(+) antiporter GerT n=1 Tax=Cladocopium goreaui TaxID=2562237 RepID=A0A9P1C8A5_9DINO|nr:unnamed protein product [Cladocopium goreaui]
MGDEFFIDIVFIAGGQTQLLVQDSDHVKDVKIRLKEHCESPNTSFKLLFCGADLPDDRTLYSLGVGPTERGSPCLYCVGMEDVGEVTRTGKNMLSVINLSGGHVALPAGEFDMVGDLKETLTRSLTLPVDRMRLLHRGSELKNETPLSKLTEGLGASSPAPIYVFERPDHSHNVGDRAGRKQPLRLETEGEIALPPAYGLHSGLQSIKPMEVDHFQSDANESHFNEADDFGRLYAFLLFTAALWISGKLFARLGMPALVGEILVGILAGPHAKNLVPETDALILQGEFALVLLMIEAGLHVDMEMIKIVGLRALAVGVIGSFLPMGLGMAVATLILRLDAMESFAIGASFATMSTGIALNVMKAGGVLNQPSGQLLLAAATVNELINISLITEIDAVVANGPWHTFVVPIVIMLFLVVFMSFLAVKVVPCFLDQVLPRVDPKNQENVVLGLLLATTVVYMPACKLTGSSALLGAFLAGFCFCTDEHVHHTWKRQVKRVATFLMRYFFACSIGFTVPVEDFRNIEVWRRASILLVCIVGKICMGLFAMPLTLNEFLSLGFAWGSWGEFSFILAVRALRGNLLSGENYSALVLAVLISILICPTALRFVLSRSEKEAKRCIQEAKKDTAWDETGVAHPVYYCIQTRSHALWGQQGALLNMLVEVGCKIVDFRSFHPFSDVGTQHVINELYLKDTQLQLVLAEQLEPADQERLNLRTKEILRAVLAALRSAEVKIFRWQPGEGTSELIEEVHHGASSYDVPVGSFRRSESPYDQIAAQQAHVEIQQAMTRHGQGDMRAVLDEYCHPGTPKAHHELDGWVHTDAHDAFHLMNVKPHSRSMASSEDFGESSVEESTASERV